MIDRNVDKHNFINKKTIFDQSGSWCSIILCEFFYKFPTAHRLFVNLKTQFKLYEDPL